MTTWSINGKSSSSWHQWLGMNDISLLYTILCDSYIQIVNVATGNHYISIIHVGSASFHLRLNAYKTFQQVFWCSLLFIKRSTWLTKVKWSKRLPFPCSIMYDTRSISLCGCEAITSTWLVELKHLVTPLSDLYVYSVIILVRTWPTPDWSSCNPGMV